MKPSSLLILLPAFSEVSIVSAAAIKAPSTLKNVSVAKPADSSSNALEARQRLPEDVRDVIVGVAVVGGFLYGQGVDWYGLSKECRASKVAESAGEQRDCGLAASAKAMNTLYAAVGAWATFKSIKAALDAYLQPYYKEKRTLLARELEPSLSDMFGNQVRHLGHWSDNAELLSSRDDAPDADIPVFGTVLDGINMHFAVRDFNETSNNLNIRFGFGHGERLEGLDRRDDNEPLFFNNYGIDIEMLHMDLANQEDIKPSQELERSITEQLKCHFREENFDEIDLNTCNQMWVQMYDMKGKGTVAVANLAPFGRDGHSQIKHMGGYRNNLDLDYQCMPSPFF